jgi:serine O-acetyltransferase
MFKQLREDITCIHQRDPAARSRFEILTCYPGLHAIMIHRLAHALWQRQWLWSGRFISHIGRIFTGIEIHPGAQIGRRVFIDHGFGVVIGETAVVGDDCTIYQGVTLGGTRLYKGEKRHPTLEEGVVVGAGAQILGGFTVGAHARIGSNAVVVKPVPAHATAVGNPARILLKEDAERHHHGEDIPPKQAEHTPEDAPLRKPGEAPLPCQTDWSGKPLQDLLRRGKAEPAKGASEAAEGTEGFAAYGVDRDDDDPLVKVLHELINHAANQETRITRLCKAMEDLGQRIENGQKPLDVERLNRMVD